MTARSPRRDAALALTSALAAACASGGAPRPAIVDGPSAPSSASTEPAAASAPAASAPPARSARVDVQLEDIAAAATSGALANRVRSAVEAAALACARDRFVEPGTRVRVLLGSEGDGVYRVIAPELEPLSDLAPELAACLSSGIQRAALHGRKGETGPRSVVVSWLR